MPITAIKSPGIAHTSYYVSSRGESLVIDPRRDIDEYLKLARDECTSIKYIFETHRNEDYVIGSLELKKAVDADICHSKETPFTYGDHALNDDEKFKIGDLEVGCIWTPGHTFDSFCYTIRDTKNNCDSPFAVFSGDTLFVGDVGRTDLPGHQHWEKLSGLMHDSLHEKIFPLGDHVIVYPGHTSGSICGSNIGDREVSTIGYERKTNPQLSMTRAEFIDDRLRNIMPRPPYFRRMEDWNLNGAPLLKDLAKPAPLTPREFIKYAQRPDSFILDTRQPDAYAASHIPDSINIWLNGVTYYPGWIVDYDNQILLVSERREDIPTVSTYLTRIGYDNIYGYLCPGIDAWRNAAMPTVASPTLHVNELKDLIEKNQVKVIDVREDHEYDSGHIRGSQNIYVGYLKDRLEDIPKHGLTCVACGWGGRGSIAASLLDKKGYRCANLLGGMNAWRAAKMPLEVVKSAIKKEFAPVCPL